MATLQSMINQVLRRVQPGQHVESLILNGAYTAGSTSMSFNDPAGTILGNLRPETTIAIDLELFYVQAISGFTATVVPGYAGSTEAGHASGSLVYVNPRFTQFDIMQAINDDLNDLCSPENNLYQVKSVEITYSPATVGYDLTGVTNLIDIISIQQKQPYPVGYWVPIPRKKRTLTAGADTTAFPSGYALRLNAGGDGGDPAFTLLESGLTASQLASLDEYSGAHALCPTCTQRLNSNPATQEQLDALVIPRET